MPPSTKSKTHSIISQKIAEASRKKPPLWDGPTSDTDNGGVTQSLIGGFLACRERFRVKVIEGLAPADRFESKMEFGNMWHACEEYAAQGQAYEGALNLYCQDLARKYPLDREHIKHWREKCITLFPVYVDYWSKHKDMTSRTPLLQEQVFKVPYRIPSGRVVYLRGKWDSVDLVGKGKNAGIWVQENKTKSSIDASKIRRQLAFDLQTMMYFVALEYGRVTENILMGTGFYTTPIKGVRYNVIKRSSHKTAESMMKKVEEDMADGRAGEWFARWNVEISHRDVEVFRERCLDPILEQMCDWYQHVINCHNDPKGEYGDVWGERFSVDGDSTYLHWQQPYGLYSVVNEGGFDNVDDYLATGSSVGLKRKSTVFPELQ